MRISGTEPSSVTLSKTKVFKKIKSDAPKVPKQTKAKRDGVISPINYNFNQTQVTYSIILYCKTEYRLHLVERYAMHLAFIKKRVSLYMMRPIFDDNILLWILLCCNGQQGKDI